MTNRPDSGAVESRRQGPLTRVFIGFSALLLVFYEVAGIWQTYRVIELYAPPDATALFAAADRLVVAHGIRILVIATLIIGWRWSLWLTVATYVLVYVPNPWITARTINPDFWPVLLLPLFVVAIAADRRLLWPWRDSATSRKAAGRN